MKKSIKILNVLKYFFTLRKNLNYLIGVTKKKIKIIQIFKLEEIKTYNITHAIVINKNKDHFNYTKKLLKMKVKTLVEKPIVENLSQFNIYAKFGEFRQNSAYLFFNLFFFRLHTQNSDISSSLSSGKRIGGALNTSWTFP